MHVCVFSYLICIPYPEQQLQKEMQSFWKANKANVNVIRDEIGKLKVKEVENKTKNDAALRKMRSWSRPSEGESSSVSGSSEMDVDIDFASQSTLMSIGDSPDVVASDPELDPSLEQGNHNMQLVYGSRILLRGGA